MKRYGFTLAEVLITLGIIGVVSAMVIPTFTQSTQNAKIGPRLAKAVAALEQANKASLSDAESDSLTGAGLTSAANYTGNLTRHMKGAFTNPGQTRFLAADGVSYTFLASFINGAGDNPLHQTVVNNQVMIDINGEGGPNTDARDRFYFQMMDDGSLRPWGGSWEDARNRWYGERGQCLSNERPRDPQRCAGHVMENGLKVEYK